MNSANKQYISLLCFNGAGSKLLQAQLGNAKDVFTIPAYPLKYLPLFFEKWKKSRSFKNKESLLKLVIKQHKSILDSRYIKGFNGLNAMGRNQSSHIKISENKFKKSFLDFLSKKDLSRKNIILAIHHAYQYSINNKSKNILYHTHATEIYSKYLLNDFDKSKVIAINRDPIHNFWRRAYADEKIELERFDFTDCEYIKNYRYINRLRDLYLNFKYFNKRIGDKCKFYTFEDLKVKNFNTLKKICNFLKVPFDYKKIQNPKFQNKIWWGSKIYKGFTKKKSFVKDNFNKDENLKLFSMYEIFVLEFSLFPYIKKFNFTKKIVKEENFLNHILFFLKILLPTKYGLNLFFKRLHPMNISNYLNNVFKEAFGKKKIKNYYFNGMYSYHFCYRITYLININLFRKFFFKYHKNILAKLFYIFSKVLVFMLLQLELLGLYFIRIFLIISLYLNVRRKISYINLG